ncbi:hypothetical protein ACX1DW_01500 [Stutzerimonas sp. KH-1]|jgi:hypothetical protein
MSEGFTPGDWHVSELEATGQKSEFYIFIEPGVAVIERSVTGEHDMNDARLLAAAKELYTHAEALLADVMQRYGIAADGLTCPHMRGLAEAIAKARGTPC